MVALTIVVLSEGLCIGSTASLEMRRVSKQQSVRAVSSCEDVIKFGRLLLTFAL